jgi:glycosyltransferase involved in cell wall biosynthesis
MSKLKVSIITCVYNRENTILESISSVGIQTYPLIEHILIDGGSTDETLGIVQKHFNSRMVLFSEPDYGIYDAINKGIMKSTGDVVCLLHSDDTYASNSVIAEVVKEFSNPELDAVYGDAVFFKHGNSEKIHRHYRSDRFSPQMLSKGWMPAHTTLFLRRRVFEKYGLYKINYKIAGDMDFVARIFKSGNLQSKYIPKIMVRMRTGGVSTGGVKNTILLNREVLRALRENGIKTNIIKLLSKYPLKFLEFFR